MDAGVNCVCNVCGSAHSFTWSMTILLGQPVISPFKLHLNYAGKLTGIFPQ